MSLNFYDWFCRDVLRLSEKRARREALRRKLQQRLKLKKARQARKKWHKPSGLPEGHNIEGLQSEGDGDVTVYPEVQ